jgi:hypothetical protein
MLKKFSNNLKSFFLKLKEINNITKRKPRFIFYSENKSYLKYGYSIIEYLSKKFPGEVYYISSDVNDKVSDLNVINVYIGQGFLLQYFFKSIETSNLFMTLTDLNNTVKRNNFVKNYIYYFHAAVSTTKNYTATAFDNYDIILCNGDYQVKEIRQREKLVNLKEKKLIKSGYFYFDYLQRKINYKIIPDEILIAPSWNYNQKNFINENLELIIKEILQKGYKVRFRPHPENFVRSKNKIEYICNKFKNELFTLDSSKENKESMEKAKCLITDNSGIAIEYILLFKKPVLYFDDVDKIHNKEFDKYKNLQTMDNIVKDKFGFSFTINEIESLDLIIEKSISEFINKDNEIKVFTNKNFYNFNQTIKKFEDLTHKYFD